MMGKCNSDRWLVGHARDTRGPSWPGLLLTVLRADLYSSSVLTYSLDNQFAATKKKGDMDE